MYKVYTKEGNFVTVSEEEDQPEGYVGPWEIDNDAALMIQNGATIELRNGELTITNYPKSVAIVQAEINPRYLSQTKFLARLSTDELRGIYLAADANIDVRIWLDKFKMAGDIWLDHPDLVNGLHAFIRQNIFTESRVKEILS